MQRLHEPLMWLSILKFHIGVGAAAFSYSVGLGWLARWWLGAPGMDIVWGASAAVGVLAGCLAIPLQFGTYGGRWASLAMVIWFPGYLLAVLPLLLYDWIEGRRWRRTWPRSVDEAVDRVLTEYDGEARERLRALSLPRLAAWYGHMRADIRMDFGLASGNQRLLRDCGCDDPNAASEVIAERILHHIVGPPPASDE